MPRKAATGNLLRFQSHFYALLLVAYFVHDSIAHISGGMPPILVVDGLPFVMV